ncbi:MAG: hypothetical protein ABI458_04535 [Chloroflexota bacterium]
MIVDRLEVIDFLAVIDFPSNFQGGAQSVVELGKGSEVLLTFGPLAAHGRDWYEVYFSWLPTDVYFTDVTYGWIATGPSGQPPTSISIAPPRCPDTVTATVVGGMSSLARLECLGTGPHEVTGVVHGCTNPTPYPGEPEWLFDKCLNLSDLDGIPTNLFIFFPPEIVKAGLDVGDVVRVVGHVDDPAASTCRPSDPPISEAEQSELVLDCRTAFVLSEIEVTGHTALPQ